ncbi:MAG: hypothetical protein ABFR32_11965 [Bacteroidota bacterium]
MKKIKLALGATSIIILLAFSYKYIQVDIKEKIIGTWHMIDPNDINQEIILPTKWVFTSDNNCIWYENNILIREFSYNITNYSCNDEYDSVYRYLKLENPLDLNEVFCYAINGISEEEDKMYLSIEFDGNPRPMVFKKNATFQNPHELPEDQH